MEQAVTTNVFGVPRRSYQVRLTDFTFEGPLDLLLQLIERNELPITEIALARICDEYLRYINQLTEVNPSELADFLVVATRLLYLKSQALLPQQPSKSGESSETEEDSEDLVEQLREYKQMKEASRFLVQRQEQGRSYVTQRVGPHETLLDLLTATLKQQPDYARNEAGLQGVQLKDLLALVQRRLNAQIQQQLKLPLPASEQQLKRLVHSIKIADRIKLIKERLDVKENSRVEFSSLFFAGDAEDRMPSNLEVIVTFMALLELVRNKQANAYQDGLFSEIYIEKANS